MEKDSKYDTSFRKAELAVKKENEKINTDDNFETDDNSDLVAEAIRKTDDHITREPHDFGGGRGWI